MGRRRIDWNDEKRSHENTKRRNDDMEVLECKESGKREREKGDGAKEETEKMTIQENKKDDVRQINQSDPCENILWIITNNT